MFHLLFKIFFLLALSLQPAVGNVSGEYVNLGHRVGAGEGEYHEDLPENSIKALKAALLGRYGKKALQFYRDFVYLEFDVHETRDNRLVLFHDKHLTRMLPENVINRLSISRIIKSFRQRGRWIRYEDLTIRDLTLRELQTLALEGTVFERVPTLEKFLEKCKKWKLKKPITLEIKRIHSNKARKRLITLLSDFRDSYLKGANIEFVPNYDLSKEGANFLSFPGHFSRSFGGYYSRERIEWCQKFKESGFYKIYRAIYHYQDLCE